MQHCSNCGTRLTPAARFCPGCGAAADSQTTHVASEETRLSPPRPPRPVVPVARPRAAELRETARATDEPDEERVVFTVRPTLLFVKIGYALAAMFGVLLAALSA